MLDSIPSDEDEIDLALRMIRDAWRKGRRIVPLIGAGISVDSGMPVVQGIERYLAMLHLYLQHGVYLCLNGRRQSDREAFKEIRDFYKREPDDFVRDFQWPDRFNLQQDLCAANIWSQCGLGEHKEQHTAEHLVNFAFRELLSPAIGWKTELLANDVPTDGDKLHNLFGNWRTFIEHFTEYDDAISDAGVNVGAGGGGRHGQNSPVWK